MPKRPDYGDATPEDLALALMHVRLQRPRKTDAQEDKPGTQPGDISPEDPEDIKESC